MKIKLFSNGVKKPAFNINHTDIADKIELAFQVRSHKYYRFKEDVRMPAGRYKWVDAYFKEVQLRMSIETLKAYIEEIRRCLSGAKKIIDLDGAFKALHNMETRISLDFEPEGVRKLASVVYFDDAEDLSGYDMAYNKKKIEFWKKNNVTDFFLTRPIDELLRLSDISVTSLEEYIVTAEQIIKDLTVDPQTPLSGNTSKNGKKTS